MHRLVYADSSKQWGNNLFDEKESACSIEDASYQIDDVMFAKIDCAEPHS